MLNLRRSDLADAAFLCDRSDLVDEAEWIREILPAGLKHRALRRRQELRVHSHDAHSSQPGSDRI